MQHKGEILKNAVLKRVNNITALAKQVGYDRASLYRHFADDNLDDGIILKYAQALKYNFNYEFPELTQFTNVLQEPITEYKPMTVSEALKESDYWRGKYIDLLEKHNQMLNDRLSEKK